MFRGKKHYRISVVIKSMILNRLNLGVAHDSGHAFLEIKQLATQLRGLMRNDNEGFEPWGSLVKRC